MRESEIQDQPYRPPASMSVARTWEVSTNVDLPKTSVLVMILLTIATLGLYELVWFLRRRRALNQLWPEHGIDGRLVILVALQLGGLVAGFVVGFLSPLWASSPGWTFIDLAAGLASLILRFRVKDILEASYHDDVSGLGTFFFGIFYLQYKINRIQQKSADRSLLSLNQLDRSVA